MSFGPSLCSSHAIREDRVGSRMALPALQPDLDREAVEFLGITTENLTSKMYALPQARPGEIISCPRVRCEMDQEETRQKTPPAAVLAFSWFLDVHGCLKPGAACGPYSNQGGFHACVLVSKEDLGQTGFLSRLALNSSTVPHPIIKWVRPIPRPSLSIHVPFCFPRVRPVADRAADRTRAGAPRRRAPWRCRAAACSTSWTASCASRGPMPRTPQVSRACGGMRGHAGAVDEVGCRVFRESSKYPFC